MRTVATIKDVARAAGVSASTVSNVLNGREHLMHPTTSQRVRDAIDSLRYRPSRAARELRSGRGLTFGLIVPSVANPFWGSWAAHLEAAALTCGRQLYLCNSDRDAARERMYVEQLRADGVDCVVLSTSMLSLDHLGPAMDGGLRVIAFDRERQPDDPEQLTSLSVNNEEGARLATHHLIELGHRRIGFVSGSLVTVSRRARVNGYRRALAEGGIAVDDELIQALDEIGDVDSGALGRAAMSALLQLDDPPTAVVAINDMFALGAYAAVREAGQDIASISIVGFDDIPLSSLISPALTTVRQPLPEMAETVLRLVVGGTTGESILLPPSLVVRQSTRPFSRST